MEVYNEKLIQKYSNSYFRELVILYHIDELSLKAKKHISEDSKPFKQIDFIKELADLYILLDLYKNIDINFKNMIEERANKFMSHLEKELKTDKLALK
jgi:hypothetical protein